MNVSFRPWELGSTLRKSFLFGLLSGLVSIPALAVEVCGDNIDNDSDSLVDEGCSKFTTIQQRTSGTLSNKIMFNWRKAITYTPSNGYIHMAWIKISAVLDPNNPGAIRGALMYARSTNNGSSWGTPLQLTGDTDYIGYPAIAATGSSVYIALTTPGPQILVARSTNSGTNWSGQMLPDSVGAGFPSIAASGNNVIIAWSAGDFSTGASEVFISRSTNGGSSYSAQRTMVSTSDGRSSWVPSVALSGQTAYFAWSDDRHNVDTNGNPYDCGATGIDCREEEYFRRSADLGVTFGPEVRLTFDPVLGPASSWAPSVAVHNGVVHIAYFDSRSGAFQIYYNRSSTDGVGVDGGFGVEKQLTNEGANALRPSLGVNGNNVQIAYFSVSGIGTSYINHMISANGGATFSDPLVLRKGADVAQHPSLIITNTNYAHVVWYDKDPSTNSEQMFYVRRNP